MMRSTRFLDTGMPPAKRRRAHTLRWPSPVKGEVARSFRISVSSSSSDISVLGPVFCFVGTGVSSPGQDPGHMRA